MAIDFQRAFDSTSWQFLYDALQLFGFDNSLIDWIKMFNRSITARVQQCGFLSEPITIERGCRQGVLSIIIKMVPEIVGIKIGKTEFKVVQYADDTTIILDGSRLPAGNIECAGDLWLIIWVEGEHGENKDHMDR